MYQMSTRSPRFIRLGHRAIVVIGVTADLISGSLGAESRTSMKRADGEGESGSIHVVTVTFRPGVPNIYQSGDCIAGMCPFLEKESLNSLQIAGSTLVRFLSKTRARLVVRAWAHACYWGDVGQSRQYDTNVGRRRAQALADYAGALYQTQFEKLPSESSVIISLGNPGASDCPCEEEDSESLCPASRRAEIVVCWGPADCAEETSPHSGTPSSAQGRP